MKQEPGDLKTLTVDDATNLLSWKKLSRRRMLQPVLGFFDWLWEPVLRFRQLNRAYADLLRTEGEGPFFNRALEVLKVNPVISESDLEKIPKSGPVVLVCNHPYGGLDGIVMGAILERHRPDNKLLVNGLLDHLRGIRERCIYVDPFGTKESKRRNLAGIRQSIQWLQEGHLLATWPAGEVSHFQLRKAKVTDPAWSPHLVPLIEKSKAVVVPVFFEGRNSNLFQLLGMIHPRLRTLFLPREMMRMSGKEVRLRIGNPISASRLAHLGDANNKMDFLRLRSYILSNRHVAEKTTFNPTFERKASEGERIIEPLSARLLSMEIEHLPAGQRLVSQNEYAVYIAQAAQIPHLLREIGRLREVTFRAVGEGTGRSLDLDEFDPHYWHLFMWNHAEQELVGAYRIGATDRIFPEFGKRGLYTTTLFRFRSAMIKEINPALELGRSFVIEKYQRKPVSLSLIWRGIGTYISQNPKYKILFGPVSISREYESLSKNLIVMYLKENTLDPEFSNFVKAKNPPKSRFMGSLDKSSFKRSVKDIDDVSALISEIEREEKGVPTLLKQYLRMNATLLSFNVDPEFNDCIDGLVLVDLSKSSEKTLSRYMGNEGARKFLDYHEIREEIRR